MKLVTLVVDGLIDGSPVRYQFPVHLGAPLDAVKREAYQILQGDPEAARMEGVAIQYPVGPWEGAVDPGSPPLGAQYAAPITSSGSEQPPRPSQPFRSAAEALAAAAADRRPQVAAAGYTPLPGEARKGPSDPTRDLMAFLAAWAGKHQLTGAEYYHYLALALGKHSEGLLALERTTRRS